MMTKRETIAEMLERGAELQTADGQDVRILMTDGGGPRPVLGALFNSTLQHWMLYSWGAHGEADSSKLDLIEKPQTRVYEQWVNVHENGVQFAYSSRENADSAASRSRHGKRLACIHIRQEYTVGEGLEDETANQEDTDNE